jgi:hypothetical protein
MRSHFRIVSAALRLGPAGVARSVLHRLRLRALHLPRSARALAGGNAFGIRLAAKRGAFSDVQILSMKFDAFGGRIWNLLNAIRVADSLGAQMRFAWPLRPLDGIRSAEETFATDFLEEHYVTQVDVTRCRHVRVWRPDDVLRLRGSSDRVWYESKHKDRRFDKFEVASDGFRFPGLPTFRDAFDRIQFRSDLEEIRREAEALPPFRLAIHIRRGDVSHGDFRVGSHFVAKAIPFPLVEALISDAASSRVLLIGNDLAGLESRGLTRLPNVSVAAHLLDVSPDDELAAVMRDFCLMTRCEQIVAGDSLFAILPARIAGAQLLSPSEVIPADRELALLRSSISGRDVHFDAETAVVCTYLQGMFGDVLEDQEREELLSLAYRCDPENPSLLIAQAAVHLRCERPDLAGSIFREASLNGAAATCVRLLRNTFDGVIRWSKWSRLRCGDWRISPRQRLDPVAGECQLAALGRLLFSIERSIGRAALGCTTFYGARRGSRGVSRGAAGCRNHRGHGRRDGRPFSLCFQH